jgi:hypothetical protein
VLTMWRVLWMLWMLSSLSLPALPSSSAENGPVRNETGIKISAG